jgi:hypothetical protein
VQAGLPEPLVTPASVTWAAATLLSRAFSLDLPPLAAGATRAVGPRRHQRPPGSSTAKPPPLDGLGNDDQDEEEEHEEEEEEQEAWEGKQAGCPPGGVYALRGDRGRWSRV